MNGRGQLFYRRYLAGKDDRDDEKRREFILNTLLCGISATGIFSLLGLYVIQWLFGVPGFLNILPALIAVTAMCLLLWVVSRSGHPNAAAYLFICGLGSVLAKLGLTWGFELPGVSLGLALLITIAGVILQRRSALYVGILLSTGLLVLGYFQSYGILTPREAWVQDRMEFIHSLGYAVLLGLIGFVSWLANREIDHSLSQVRESKRSLAKERDSLESRVIARTQELEQAQLVRILELQRFADFGRLSAHLLHEIANPLTAATLHLNLADSKQNRAIQQAKKNLQQLERYVNATRNQLRAHSTIKRFSVRDEARHTLAVLAPIAQRANVKLTVDSVPADLKLHGDPVKFTQIVANIIVNAIDAYDGAASTRREVLVSGYRKSDKLYITVQDWGKGIEKARLSQIFEPFYTTKGDSPRGLGIGLALVKQAIAQDYQGRISVTSSLRNGTVFTLEFMLDPRARRQKSPANSSEQGVTMMLAPPTLVAK
jgi:signal transduction histidine kinase